MSSSRTLLIFDKGSFKRTGIISHPLSGFPSKRLVGSFVSQLPDGRVAWTLAVNLAQLIAHNLTVPTGYITVIPAVSRNFCMQKWHLHTLHENPDESAAGSAWEMAGRGRSAHKRALDRQSLCSLLRLLSTIKQKHLPTNLVLLVHFILCSPCLFYNLREAIVLMRLVP